MVPEARFATVHRRPWSAWEPEPGAQGGGDAGRQGKGKGNDKGKSKGSGMVGRKAQGEPEVQPKDTKRFASVWAPAPATV